jgi:hypothetical protein
MDNDLTPQILRRAYEIWENEGRPHGRDQIHWLLAEAELSNSDRQQAVEPSRTKRKPRSASPASARSGNRLGR